MQLYFRNNFSGVSLSPVIDRPVCSGHVFQCIVCGWSEYKKRIRLLNSTNRNGVQPLSYKKPSGYWHTMDFRHKDFQAQCHCVLNISDMTKMQHILSIILRI